MFLNGYIISWKSPRVSRDYCGLETFLFFCLFVKIREIRVRFFFWRVTPQIPKEPFFFYFIRENLSNLFCPCDCSDFSGKLLENCRDHFSDCFFWRLAGNDDSFFMLHLTDAQPGRGGEQSDCAGKQPVGNFAADDNASIC